jgi:molybdopterin-containing oxidoreductase family iron-sulfur binding subunit
MKCDFCLHLMEVDRLPYCVSGCPRKALYTGDLNEDIVTNGAEIVKLSSFLNENNAHRYKEELGTQPRVWYIPGHGQEFGMKAGDNRELIPTIWPWGNEDDDEKPGIGSWR